MRAHDPYNEVVITEQRYKELLWAERELAAEQYAAQRALERGGDAVFLTADGLEATARIGSNYRPGCEYVRPVRQGVSVLIAEAESDVMPVRQVRRYMPEGRRGKFPVFREITP